MGVSTQFINILRSKRSDLRYEYNVTRCSLTPRCAWNCHQTSTKHCSWYTVVYLHKILLVACRTTGTTSRPLQLCTYFIWVCSPNSTNYSTKYPFCRPVYGSWVSSRQSGGALVRAAQRLNGDSILEIYLDVPEPPATTHITVVRHQ